MQNASKIEMFAWLILITFFLTFIYDPLIIIKADSCKIKMLSSINFGNYNPLLAHNITSYSTIIISCYGGYSKTTPVELRFGSGSSHTYKIRTMENMNNKLYYNLYTDVRENNILGNGQNNTKSITIIASNNQNISVNIWGLVFGGQTNIQPGIYSDIITIELTF